MTALTLKPQRDAVVHYVLEAAGQRVGEIRAHAAHADILRIGAQAWWLADDVATPLHLAGASIARRIYAHVTQPRSFSLVEDGGARVLARAERSWRWSTRADGLTCRVGEVDCRIRSEGAWGGRFAFEDAAGQRLGEIGISGFARNAQTAGLPVPLAEAAFLLYATHRIYAGGTDGGSDGGGE
jgi:hypothetical protein